jgi:Flp pilus assembly protein CpaB
MKRNNLIFIIGGALLVFVLVLVSLRAATSTAATVLAARPIAAGTRLSTDDLIVQPINTNSRLTSALGKPEDAIGKVILIARAPGDQITLDQISDRAGVGIPAHLDPGTVAIGVHVNLASGLGGALREGDTVSVIAVLDPRELGGSLNTAPIAQVPVSLTNSLEITATATPQPETTAARLTISGLKVLLVPQSFRYEEVPTDKTGQLSPVRSSTGAQQNNVVLLAAPLAPIEVVPGVTMSPVELLALLDERATIHLALEPREGLDRTATTIGVQLAEVYDLLINRVPIPSPSVSENPTPTAPGNLPPNH